MSSTISGTEGNPGTRGTGVLVILGTRGTGFTSGTRGTGCASGNRGSGGSSGIRGFRGTWVPVAVGVLVELGVL